MTASCLEPTKIGCGTCHQQQAAFTHHGHDLSHGVDDLIGTRNAPSVQNMAWNTSFFWDGGVHDMDMVPPVPIQNKVEMDERVPNVIEKLKKTPVAGAAKQVDYPKMFKAAFGTNEINADRMMQALSQFMMSMISATSRYDYFVRGDASALTVQEKGWFGHFQTKVRDLPQRGVVHWIRSSETMVCPRTKSMTRDDTISP